MPLEAAVIINVVGENTEAAAEDESTWHANYFPSMYDSTWSPGGTTGFFIGHRPTPAASGIAESYLWVNVGEIGGWEINGTEIFKNNVHINSTTELIQLGTVTDFSLASGEGVLLGSDGSSDYDFFAGDTAGDNIHWDGSAGTLTISGDLTATTGQIGTW